MTGGCVQRSDEWRELRCAKVTGSRIADLLATLKNGGEAASRKNYKAEIISETLTGVPLESYISKEMQWGIDTEPFARAAYELACDTTVDDVGFAIHPTIPRFGASPDGLVGEDGLVELKCPNTATHIDYILAGNVPAEYQAQMLAEMACTGRQWCDFVSFDPRLPNTLQLFVRRFPRDQKRIQEMEEKVQKFLAEVDDTILRLELSVPIQGGPREDNMLTLLQDSLSMVQAHSLQREDFETDRRKARIAEFQAKGPQPVVEVLDKPNGEAGPF